MKEVSTIARTLSIGYGRGGGVLVTPPSNVVDNRRMVVQLELSYTIGIDHPQPNEDCVIDISPCP
jgi:hypothetical protein